MSDQEYHFSYIPGRAIPLTKGQVAVVDADDYDWLMQWKWQANWYQKSKKFMAGRNLVINGKSTRSLMHRDIMKAPRELHVDHRNHDTLDNRRLNLRLATNMMNMQNYRAYSKSTSGYRGVCWHKGARKWMGHIRVNGTLLYLGLFDTPEAASAAYEATAREHRGEFYCEPGI